MDAPNRRLAKLVLGCVALGCAALLAPQPAPAQQPPAPPARHAARCPRHRPETGGACRVERASCQWRCGREGDSDLSCACERGADGALRWQCRAGPVCAL